jgi:Cu-processing system permease protein
VFVAIGYFISAIVRDRGLAGGLAIGVWLLFVLIYDMALLGLLVVDKGRVISAGVLDALLLLNPADAFRVLNLTGSGGVSQFAGMAGLSEDAGLSPAVLVGALLLWTVLPLGGAALALGRRQL